MSTLNTTNLKHPSSGSNNIVLDSSGNTRVTAITDSAGANSSTPEAIANGTAKAWVNFNGTGTVAIRASFNVSSITDNGTGNFTVNFTTAMVDANYAFAGFARGDASGNGYVTSGVGLSTTVSALRINTLYNSTTVYDSPEVNVAIFR